MQLRDFVFVTHKLSQILTDESPEQMYTRLADALDQYKSSNPPPESVIEVINDNKKEIRRFNYENNPTSWSFSRLEICRRMGALELVGPAANDYLEGLIKDNPYGVSSEVRAVSARLAELRNALSQINKGLKTISLHDFQDIEEAEGKAHVQLVFDGAVGVNVLGDLSGQTQDLEKHIHSFVKLTNDNVEDVILSSISKNSPLTVEVLIAVAAAKFLAEAINEILDVFLKLQELKRHSLELKEAGLSSEAIENELLKKEGELKETAAADISKRVTEKAKVPNSAKRKNGTKSAVQKGVKDAVVFLLDFFEKGGKADVYLGVPNAEDEVIDSILPEQPEGETLPLKFESVRLGDIRIKELVEAQNEEEEPEVDESQENEPPEKA